MDWIHFFSCWNGGYLIRFASVFGRADVFFCGGRGLRGGGGRVEDAPWHGTLRDLMIGGLIYLLCWHWTWTHTAISGESCDICHDCLSLSDIFESLWKQNFDAAIAVDVSFITIERLNRREMANDGDGVWWLLNPMRFDRISRCCDLVWSKSGEWLMRYLLIYRNSRFVIMLID